MKPDEGITGISAGTANGWENVVAWKRSSRGKLIGQDPLMIERLRPIVNNAKLRMGWPYFIEAALWDIAGKKRGFPFTSCGAGMPNKLRVYASTGEILP